MSKLSITLTLLVIVCIIIFYLSYKKDSKYVCIKDKKKKIENKEKKIKSMRDKKISIDNPYDISLNKSIDKFKEEKSWSLPTELDKFKTIQDEYIATLNSNLK